MPARTRRRYDRLAAVALVVVVVVVAAVLWLTSDIRATDADTGADASTPPTAGTVPTGLEAAWSQPTDAGLGAIASPYGVVVTTDQHTVTGWDAVTGQRRWSYGRSNLPLCAAGSGDTDAEGAKVGGKVRGIVTIYEKNGLCSQIQALDPVTGERTYARTSPGQTGGSLVFGGPYGGWLGPTLLELWRNDLVRTFQYGDQPSPTNPGTRHLGCTFSDVAVTGDQVATVEHCDDSGPNAQLVLNWSDPGPHDEKQNQFEHTPRATIDTGSPAALLVGITDDRAAVLVSAPIPAVVVYDADGTESSLTPVDIPVADIVGATGVTRAVTVEGFRVGDPDTTRYSLVGDHLLAVSEGRASVTVTVTPTPTTPAEGSESTGESSAPASTAPETKSETRKDLAVDWVAGDALGLPAVVGGTVLLPVADGLAVLDDAGAATSTVAVDRGGYDGVVDAAAVGEMVIETRGDTVVALRRT